MKPIYLEIEGLNSFVEKQVVDFTKLGKNGIFGIFGPTGSGKSTVLDAIILSLYGRIDRAVKLIDFINVNLNFTKVRLIFDVYEDNVQTVYEICRAFKIKKNTTVVESEAVLFKLDGNERTLLGDKVKEVTLLVNEIVGMNYADFKRCIALPQGEFATFITESHVEKVNVIGRIFSLEKYGDRLSKKLDRRAREHEKEIMMFEAQQKALGDVSKEAIAGKSNDVVALKTELKGVKVSLKQLEKEVENNEKLYEKSKEIGTIEESLKKFNQDFSQIGEYKIRLERAKKAKSLMPGLKKMIEVEQDMKLQNSLAIKLEAEFESKSKAHDEELKAYDSMKKEFYENILVFKTKKDRLEALRPEFKRLEEIKAVRKKLTDEYDLVTRKVNIKNGECEDLIDLQNKCDTYIDSLNKEASNGAFDDETVKTLCDAREKQCEKEILEKRLADIETFAENIKSTRTEQGFQIDELLKSIAKLDDRLIDIDKAIDDSFGLDGSRSETMIKYIKDNAASVKAVQAARMINKNIATLSSENENASNAIIEAESRLKMMLEEVSSEEINVKNFENSLSDIVFARDDEIRDSAISAARKRLTADSLCPLCNGIIPPSLVNVFTSNNIVGVDDRVRIEIRKLIGANRRKAAADSKVKDVEMEIANIQKQVARNESEMANMIHERNSLLASFGINIASDKEEHLQDFLRVSDDRLAELQNYVRKANKVETEVAERKQELIELTSKRDALKENIRELKSESEVILQRLTDLCAECENYNKVLEQIGISSLSELLVGGGNSRTTIFAKLAEQKELKKSCEEHIFELQQEVNELKIRLNSILEQGASLEKEQLEISKRIAFDIPSGSTIEEEQKKYQDAIDSIKRLEQEAEEKYANLLSFSSGLSDDVSEAKAMCKLKAKEFETLKGKCFKELAQSGFKSIDELKDSYMNEENQNRIFEVISQSETAYNELVSKKKLLEVETQGYNMTFDDVQKFKQRFDEVQQECARLEKEVVMGETMLDDMKEKNKQLVEIGFAMRGITKKQNVLEKLMNVLENNSLMEYVALGCMYNITVAASQNLLKLTSGRYHLEYDTDFVIVDNINDGAKRGVLSLSGGETFLVSLSLAMAINESITSMSKKAMEFFFLDEGFGTLDKELVDTVVYSLEKFKENNIKIGVISHVPELQEKVDCKLILTPPSKEHGSIIKMYS